MQLVTTGQRPAMLLNILKCIEQSPLPKMFRSKMSVVLLLRNSRLADSQRV